MSFYIKKAFDHILQKKKKKRFTYANKFPQNQRSLDHWCEGSLSSDLKQEGACKGLSWLATRKLLSQRNSVVSEGTLKLVQPKSCRQAKQHLSETAVWNTLITGSEAQTPAASLARENWLGMQNAVPSHPAPCLGICILKRSQVICMHISVWQVTFSNIDFLRLNDSGFPCTPILKCFHG